MAERSFISIESVSKSFGSVRAVDNVSIGIRRGEFFGLLGPSGCGKTTLLRMLGGFEVPDAGEIYIDGEPMAAVPPHLRPVNTVFQSYAIFPHLNVFQNIAFGLRKERLARSEVARRVDEALALIRLEGYGGRGAHELSGGQRQRVALARALIRKPKVLLLDEPLGALDKKLREHMQIELRDLQRSLGITFVFVTHDQDEALTMSDRIAVMAGGQVLEAGPPAELYARPRTRFVADFIGTMNVFEGRVTESRGDRCRIALETLGHVEVATRSMGHAIGDSAIVALRPEHIAVAPVGDGDAVTGLTGEIRKLAYLGDRTIAYVAPSEGGKLIVAALRSSDTAAAPGDGRPQRVRLSWRDDALVLLERE